MTTSTVRRRLPVLEGVLPIDRKQIPVDMLAGVTLAALGIPEVMGYTKIAGMLGVSDGSGDTIHKFLTTLSNIGDTSMATLAVSLSVIVVIIGSRMINHMDTRSRRDHARPLRTHVPRPRKAVRARGHEHGEQLRASLLIVESGDGRWPLP